MGLIGSRLNVMEHDVRTDWECGILKQSGEQVLQVVGIPNESFHLNDFFDNPRVS